MQHPVEPNWSRWFRHAAEDLKYARILKEEGGHYLTCYLAQQVAEKALKAFLYAQGEEIVLGHSIQQLAKRIGAFDPELEKTALGCTLLDSFYIPTRYPNGLPGGIGPEVYDADAASSALEMADRIVAAVARRLPDDDSRAG